MILQQETTEYIYALGGVQLGGKELFLDDDKPKKRLSRGIIRINIRYDSYYLGLFSATTIRSSDRCWH
ncbi:hypothetical protein [Nostoc sp.]|uniref:hypothetical protein n=1 Tax=Nostoc sp. TaxID=1180 RepID=UPI003FA5D211